MTEEQWDDSIKTPGYEVDPATEADPNPADGQMFTDAPPNDGGHADGAVNDAGELLRADGGVAPPKTTEA